MFFQFRGKGVSFVAVIRALPNRLIKSCSCLFEFGAPEKKNCNNLTINSGHNLLSLDNSVAAAYSTQLQPGSQVSMGLETKSASGHRLPHWLVPWAGKNNSIPIPFHQARAAWAASAAWVWYTTKSSTSEEKQLLESRYILLAFKCNIALDIWYSSNYISWYDNIWFNSSNSWRINEFWQFSFWTREPVKITSAEDGVGASSECNKTYRGRRDVRIEWWSRIYTVMRPKFNVYLVVLDCDAFNIMQKL